MASASGSTREQLEVRLEKVIFLESARGKRASTRERPFGVKLIVFVLLFQDRQILFPEVWFKTRDTQTIHRASVPLYSLLLFTGHYVATGAL
jgi:hypothetical protein